MLVLISQIGITMMVPIFFCAWMGYYVSRKTGMELLFLLFLILGILAGFRSCYQIICRFVSLQSSEEGENVRRLKNGYGTSGKTKKTENNYIENHKEHEENEKMDTEHE